MNLILGTVQFGMNYGITNKLGITTNDEVDKILEYANLNGVKYLDTAPGYGISQEVIGNSEIKGFKIISKTPYIDMELIDESFIQEVEKVLQDSLEKLSVENFSVLLVHNIKDCYKDGFENLFNYLRDLNKSGIVEKIGVSVYDEDDIKWILKSGFDIDVIQLPMNVLDQRLLKSNILKELKSKQIEIHVRSIFLQGILLEDIQSIDGAFKSALEQYFYDIELNGLSKLEAALLFCKQIKEIDYIVVGVNNKVQLQDLFEAYNKIKEENRMIEIDFSKYAVCDLDLVDPRRWKKS